MKKNISSPPRLFLRFFRWFCHPELRKYIEGDLLELYSERLKVAGKRSADFRFVIDVLLLFRPGIIKPPKAYRPVNNGAMYKSYFKIGLRNMVKNKGYSLINTGGLAAGMAMPTSLAMKSPLNKISKTTTESPGFRPRRPRRNDVNRELPGSEGIDVQSRKEPEDRVIQTLAIGRNQEIGKLRTKRYVQ